MTTTINNEHKKLNVPNLRFPEFQGEWITYKIKDVLSIGNGRDYKHLSNGEIPVFGTGGYMTSVDKCLYDGETTFIGRKGSINKPFYYNGKFWTVDTLFYTHSFNGITPKFTYCLFQTINWLKYNEASGVPSLSKDTIENGIYQRKNNKMYSALDTVGISTSSSYDEYCRRWQKRVSKDTIEDYLKLATSKKIIELFNNGNTIVSIDYRTMDTQDTEMWIDKSIYLSKDKLTDDILGIISLRNVTERYRQEYLKQRLEKQASLDLLTGLYNHVTGELLIKSRIDNSAHMYSAFVIFDIDSFKLVNDTYGHYFGDCVIQYVAKRLAECTREDQDIAIRYGGDEFVVYIEYKDSDNIEDIVKRIFNYVTDEYDGYKISVSMGISLSVNCGLHYYNMYQCADKALYEAKKSGRGCYRFYSE
mgnify:CR=1 FL=1